VDVDAVCDGEDVLIGGIMEHIEQAGVHSGDSSCSLPPNSLSRETQRELREQTRKLAHALNVVGLMNIQFAIQAGVIYVLEVNPRASRTVPFVSKATGLPLAKIAARVMSGRKLKQLVGAVERVPGYFSVKEAVFPFVKFPEADPILGPEMKSTGEVMGGAETFGAAFAKAQMGAGQKLPQSGTAFISVNNRDKAAVVPIARDLARLGFSLMATRGTAAYLRAHGIDASIVFKINEGRPHVGDELRNKRIALVINTPLGRDSYFDDRAVRSVAMMQGVPAITTLTGAAAAVSAIEAMRSEGLTVKSLQEYHQEMKSR
jgi:carbamoyl-phosphate synthase large subunit